MEETAETADPGALTDGAALVAVEHQVVQVRGGDRLGFLHRLLTGDVRRLSPGEGGRSLLLDLKGRVASDMHLFVLPSEVRLVVPAGQAGPTATALARYAIMDDVTIAPEPDLELLALFGPHAGARLTAVGVPVPSGFAGRAAWSHEEVPGEDGPLWLVRARGFGADGAWVFAFRAAREALEARLAAGGTRRLRQDVAEALRILAGEPRSGAEISSEYFPMEVGLGNAIDYQKGCFLGQEPIVRIRDRGHINWRLVGLRLRGETVPEAGDALESDLKPRAGRVTSAARLPGEPPVALALLHVSVPIGAEVRIRRGEESLLADVVEAQGDSGQQRADREP